MVPAGQEIAIKRQAAPAASSKPPAASCKLCALGSNPTPQPAAALAALS
jgi:hypothetical protein